jgi:hypothetical protein
MYKILGKKGGLYLFCLLAFLELLEDILSASMAVYVFVVFEHSQLLCCSLEPFFQALCGSTYVPLHAIPIYELLAPQVFDVIPLLQVLPRQGVYACCAICASISEAILLQPIAHWSLTC